MNSAKISASLIQRKADGLYRQHTIIEEDDQGMIKVDGQPYINFSSNDYLGLRHHPGVLQAWVDGLAQFGGGSGASPLVTGYSRAHHQLSETICDWLKRESVILFGSGFAANQALCQALLQRKSTLIADKYCHASLIEGAVKSDATFKRFRHNDMEHLHQLLTNVDEASETIVTTEGVFSMDGDAARLSECAALAHEHNACLMVDDAHGLGVFGDSGEGIAASTCNQNRCQILMATFGKAVGTAGAFVAGEATLIEYLINYAKHYIYSTSMPPAQAAATNAAINIIRTTQIRDALHANIHRFRERMAYEGFDLIHSESAIQPVIMGEPNKAMAFSEALKSLGLWITPIRYPTVPRGTDRLRVTLSRVHSHADIDALIDALCIVRGKL